MKVRMLVQPTGLYNGQPWPTAGEVAELPDVVGSDLCASGAAEPVAEKASDKAEKAVPKKRAEKRA